jgi:hypothetical protein
VVLRRRSEASFAKLPLAAVVNLGNGPVVYVVGPTGALERRPVAIASFTADAALVRSGVNAGERIVTLGVQKLEPGEKVRTLE